MTVTPHRIQHGRQTVQRLRPKDHVHDGCTVNDGLALLAGNTTTNTDDHGRVLLLELLPPSQLRKDFFLGLFTDRAGIDQDDIRLVLAIGQLEVV